MLYIYNMEMFHDNPQAQDILLSFSNAIASIRDKQDLQDVVQNILNKLFTFNDMVIALCSDDAKTHKTYLVHFEKAREIPEDFGKVLALGKCPVDDGIVNTTLASSRPVSLQIADVMKWKTIPEYIRFWNANGIRQMVGAPLRVRGKAIGGLFFYSEQENGFQKNEIDLIHNISLQLSVAMANIQANETIERQLREIDQYKQQLEKEKDYLQEEIRTVYNNQEIIGSGESIQRVFHLVAQVSPTDTSVLILGETGTGKELIARAIHEHSSRKGKLMVKVNCATLPSNLIESELFGHERGSFTGAIDRRIGKFELAAGGTLFLDEVGEIPLELQGKLLRALQEREIERIGGKTTIRINTRIIAATNRPLWQEVQAGRFRSDLYYRLNVFPISLPSLHQRVEDIPALVDHFIRKYARKTGKKIVGATEKVLHELQSYSWPGNIRELEHLIERTVLLTHDTHIRHIDLPPGEMPFSGLSADGQRIKTIDEVEREHILRVLKKSKGKVSGTGGAAQLLGIPSTTLNSKMKRLEIKREYWEM